MTTHLKSHSFGPASLASYGLMLLATVLACGCGPDNVKAEAPAAEDHAGHEHGEGEGSHSDEGEEAPTNRISLPPSARQTLGVVFVRAERRAVQRTQRIPGSIELRPEAVRTYAAPLPGNAEVNAAILQPVQAGDVLATIRPPELRKDQDELHRSKHDSEEALDAVRLVEARRTEADKTVARLTRRVRALEAASTRKADVDADADAARQRLTVLDAELKAARAKLERERHHFTVRLQAFAERVGETPEALVVTDSVARERWELVDSIVIKAASAGVVTKLPAGAGAWAEAGNVLVEVTNPDAWWFSGWALEADLAVLRGLTVATLTPTSGTAPEDRVPVSLRLGPGSQSVQRRAQVLAIPAEGTPRRSWVRPGITAFAEVVVAGSSELEFAVPREAVIRDSGETVVFLRDPADPDQVIRQNVDIGADDGRWIAVISGVGVGDEVVTAGAYALKLSSSSSKKAKGHFHADGTFHPDEE